MFTEDFYIIFPEGDTQEVPCRLPFNSLVGINGEPLSLPLPSSKVLAYRVAGIRVNERRGGNETYHLLEALSAEELIPYARG
ncbi:MAG: hypothetical protein LBR16_08230 [Treponema sp.]|jgi:hypothetical protein|nr:hypothetical protein [Treponema sp.]